MFLPIASKTKSTHWRWFDAERCLLLRPCSFIAHRASVQRPPPGGSRRIGALRTGGMSSYARAVWMGAVVQFQRQSAEPCTAPPTNPFMPLLIEPRAVKAQARFPRCSSVCGCTDLAVLRGGPKLDR